MADEPLDSRVLEMLERIDKVAPDDVPNDIILNGISLHVAAGVFNPFKGKSGRRMLRALDLVPPTPDARILEIGVGSGILSAAMWLKGCRQIVAADIMDLACENARLNFERLGMDIPVIKSDLLANITQEFDYVVFNAPTSHSARRNPESGATTLWDTKGNVKSRFVKELRERKPTGRIRAIFMYTRYLNFDTLSDIDFSGFEQSYLLVEKEEISETGVMMLSRD